MKAETFDFSKALELLKEGKFVKRTVIKNDTAICNYNSRLYHVNTETGVRYAYSPSNGDIFSNDWFEYIPNEISEPDIEKLFLEWKKLNIAHEDLKDEEFDNADMIMFASYYHKEVQKLLGD